MAEFLFFSRLVKVAEGDYFTRLFQKIHGPSQHLEAVGLAMFFKVFLRIPLLEQTEGIFILHGMKKITTPAAFFCPDSAKQGGDRL